MAGRRQAESRGLGPLGCAALWLALLPLCACGTINSYASGCPAAYSGVRTDHEYLGELDSLVADGLEWLRIAADLPLSAVADTLTLPIGVWAQQPPPTPVSPGCHWAIPRR